jgi:CO/xanthine dehydrogenase FAD-binding subunit
MLRPFDYHAPDSVAEAVALSQTCDHARFLAGGTALLVALERGQMTARTVIDLKRIRSLREIEVMPEGGLRIGALVTMRELIQSHQVGIHAPALVQTARMMATPQVRNLGTLGGNLASGLAAADLVTTLLALDAGVVMVTHEGEARMSVSDLTARGAAADVNASGIISAVIVPALEGQAAYHKLMTRQAADVALANVAVWVRAEGGQISAARIAVGGCDGRPARLVDAEAALRNQAVSVEVVGYAARIAAETAAQTGDQRASETYRQRMVGVLTRRALSQLLGIP